jgi:hypothetical protein
MTDSPRLIEVAFPLKQTSIDSVHEKNVRHGHISTLHIWPARRPLAACRAALIATLLPDPGNKKERDELLKRLGGTVVEKTKNKGKANETIKEETKGGILHWGRESSPDLDWFRQKIREAYGGRAPKVLDPFAGGGAIPLEAMRLGCEATAIDINPVAWFILKCTLEYPQKLADQKRPLPSFVLKDREFMASFFKAQGLKGASLKQELARLGLDEDENRIKGWEAAVANVESSVTLEADLASSGHKVLGAACDRVEEAGDSNPLSGMGCGERQSGGREAHAIAQLKGIENIALETLIQTKHRAIKQEKRRQKNPEKSHREGISILGLSGMASVRTFWSFCKNLKKNVCILW